MNYILITPIKDEVENLPRLKEIVLDQTVKPLIWVIVDSGSEDGSFQLSRRLFVKYEWVYIIKQQKIFESGYGCENFAEAINEGYEYAKNLCYEKGINYSFVGKTDATPVLAKDYFGTLLSYMNDDPKIAITCGTQILHYKGKRITIGSLFNVPLTGFNDIRLYSKQFFEEVGGYPLTFSAPDGILLIKAVNRGWKIKVIDKTNFIKTRLGGSKLGIWKGLILKGKKLYFLGHHPVLLLLNAFRISFKSPPHYQALPMIYGYLQCVIERHEKIQDKEVLEYYEKRLKEIICRLLSVRANKLT